MLENGADPNKRVGPQSEAPLHVATRRRRASAVETLLIRGSDIGATTAGGKTAYAGYAIASQRIDALVLVAAVMACSPAPQNRSKRLRTQRGVWERSPAGDIVTQRCQQLATCN
jgi:hypothetical protein